MVVLKYEIVFKNADGVTGDHVPTFVSKFVLYFLLHEGRLATMVNRQRQFSKDLEQGRLGLLIKFRFSISNENINEKNEN